MWLGADRRSGDASSPGQVLGVPGCRWVGLPQKGRECSVSPPESCLVSLHACLSVGFCGPLWLSSLGEGEGEKQQQQHLPPGSEPPPPAAPVSPAVLTSFCTEGSLGLCLGGREGQGPPGGLPLKLRFVWEEEVAIPDRGGGLQLLAGCAIVPPPPHYAASSGGVLSKYLLPVSEIKRGEKTPQSLMTKNQPLVCCFVVSCVRKPTAGRGGGSRCCPRSSAR